MDPPKPNEVFGIDDDPPFPGLVPITYDNLSIISGEDHADEIS